MSGNKGHIQLIQVTSEQLQNAIIEGVKIQLEGLKEHFQPKEPTEYMSRSEVAEMLSITLTTVHNWTKNGTLTSYGLERRVYYKRHEVESAIIKLN